MPEAGVLATLGLRSGRPRISSWRVTRLSARISVRARAWLHDPAAGDGKEVDGQIEVSSPILRAAGTHPGQRERRFQCRLHRWRLVGPVMFYGRGAGPGPTSSAVVADVIDLAQRLRSKSAMRPMVPLDGSKQVKPVDEIETRYYLRLQVTNRPGVFAQITRVLGESGISLASVIQKAETDSGRIAEVVLTTYDAKESAMNRAVKALSALEVVDEVSNVIRVEDANRTLK